MNGKHYGNEYIAIFAVVDGRVTEWIAYFNPSVLLEQLGNPFKTEGAAS